MTDKLRIGIAGLGSVSRQILAACASNPDVSLAAVADIRPEALERARGKYGVETFASVAAMCASREVDAVWICTPNLLHWEHAVLAAEHGKHVICEKPMAVTLEQAEAMVEAVECNRVKYVQGHSKIFDPPVRRMREIVSSGEVGRLIQLNTWEYKDWLSLPRIGSEVDTSLGGGICYRQGPHQIDVVRGICGGLVKSVRAITGRWHPGFPLTEGNYSAFLEFQDGAAATMVFNAYGYFDSTELTWGIGEGGQQQDPLRKKRPRAPGAVEADFKYSMLQEREEKEHATRAQGRRFQPFFGLTMVSCERGDIRQSPEGLYIYTDDGRAEVPCDTGGGRGELTELCEAVQLDRPTFPDARWGMATLEVVLAMLTSSAERREVSLSRQVPCPF